MASPLRRWKHIILIPIGLTVRQSRFSLVFNFIDTFVEYKSVRNFRILIYWHILIPLRKGEKRSKKCNNVSKSVSENPTMFFDIFGRNMRLILIIIIKIIIIVIVVVITSLLSPFTFILVEPLFKDKDKKTVKAKPGDNVTLECSARGYPLKVEWKLKNERDETVTSCISKFELDMIAFS